MLADFEFNQLRRQSLTGIIQWTYARWSDAEAILPSAPHPCPENYPTGNCSCPAQGCNQVFNSARAVSCHVRKSGRTEHGLVRPLSIVVVSNECCLCRSRFVSRWNVTLHMQISMNTGKCPIQCGPYLDITCPPKLLACPFSNRNLETESAHPGTNTTMQLYWLYARRASVPP